MSAYSVFVKNNNNLSGRSISGPDLRVTSGTIKKDALTKATSQIEVLGVPSAVRIGDVMGVVDEYGQIVYTGVIKDIDNNRITANQILALFDDKWLYDFDNGLSIEEGIKKVIEDDYQSSYDYLLSQIFSPFTISVLTDTYFSLEEEKEKATKNFMSFLYDLYESYGIMVDITVPFESIRPSISIGVPSYFKLKLGNDTSVLRNFVITKRVQDKNKLVIYGNAEDTYLGKTSSFIEDGSTTDTIDIDGIEIKAAKDDIVTYGDYEYVFFDSSWHKYIDIYLGTTKSQIKDGENTSPVVINGQDVVPVSGNIVTYSSKRYVYTGSAWRTLGKNSLGKTTTVLSEGSTVSSLLIEGKDSPVTAVNGDKATYNDQDFVFNGSSWRQARYALRQTYYASMSGITTNSSALDRMAQIKTEIVFSDDELADIVAKHLRNEMYNHKITCECVLNNKLYDFSSFRLGQEADIYFNGEYYNSILTGYEISLIESGVSETAKLTFGLVRDNLTTKLFKAYDS